MGDGTLLPEQHWKSTKRVFSYKKKALFPKMAG